MTSACYQPGAVKSSAAVKANAVVTFRRNLYLGSGRTTGTARGRSVPYQSWDYLAGKEEEMLCLSFAIIIDSYRPFR